LCQDITGHAQTTCQDFIVPLSVVDPLSNNSPYAPAYNASLCFYMIPEDSVGVPDAAFWTLWDCNASAGGSYYPPIPLNASLNPLNYTGLGGFTQPSDQIANLTTMVFYDNMTVTALEAAKALMPTFTACQLKICLQTYTDSRLVEGLFYDAPTFSAPLLMDASNCAFVGSELDGSTVCISSAPDGPPA
jgi:hypothetical protein